jgi:hypothetical protein
LVDDLIADLQRLISEPSIQRGGANVEPENLRFGGGVSGTVFNPAVAVILIFAGVLICILPQKRAFVPFLLTSILIPGDQVLVLAGLHFTLLRLLILFGMIRIFIIKGRGDWNVFSRGLNRVDKLVILLALASAVAGVLLFENTQAFIFQLGNLYDAFGAYFLVRCLIRDREDVVRVIRVLAIIVIALGGVMIFERLNGWNPYALLGGAKASYFATDLDRDGRIRATGSFGTPILAGVFGAVSLPLFIGLLLSDRKQRAVAVLGMLGATVMTLASNSSTPVMGYLAGLVGICLWPIRGLTRIIRWSIVITLVSLHLVMKAPVWHLITRFDISGSSYHRYALINETIRHFSEWWLIGTASNTAWGWDMWDLCNQYVAHAINGGLLSLTLFVAIIVYGFKYVGHARKAAMDRKQELFFWALGSALLAHTISFFGISYWDQSIVGWYVILGFIGAVAAPQTVQATVAPLDPEIAEADPASLRWWEQPSISRRRVHAPLQQHQSKPRLY